MKMNKLVIIQKTLTRAFSSALYIPGNKTQTNYAHLRPHIDFDATLTHKEQLINSIEARKLTINVDRLEKRWQFYKDIEYRKEILKFTKEELSKKIQELRSDAEKNKADIDTLLMHVKLIKNDLLNIVDYFHQIEDDVFTDLLKLPNILDPKTPTKDTPDVVHSFQDCPTHKSAHHLQIGTDSIEYKNPMCCFLKGQAALLEFELINKFQEHLVCNDFTQFSNCDFARSVVVEGCGLDYKNPKEIFTLSDPHKDELSEFSRLHVVGGASLSSFMAYFTKHSIQKAYLPLRLFSIGRVYQPVNSDCDGDLFNLTQISGVQIFVALEDRSDDAAADEIFAQIQNEIIVKLYEKLGLRHFRLVYLPAAELSDAESLRLSIQMFSNHFQEYREVGHVSIHNTYISERLLFNYNDDTKRRKYLKLISGCILNVQKLLACNLENKQTQ